MAGRRGRTPAAGSRGGPRKGGARLGGARPLRRLEVRNGDRAIILTPGGYRALHAFSRGEATSASIPKVATFIDGEGAERGFTSFAATASLQRLVHFAGVTAGSSVIEVGAGTGQLTFEGGLATAVGRTGLILATDPSAPWLQVLGRKAAEAEHRVVHALVAPAEELPVADGQADIALGSKFLHYCADPVAALGEMRRVARPGGTVAVLVATGGQLGAGWIRVIAPLMAAAAAYAGQAAARSLALAPGQAAAAMREAGLEDVVVAPLTEPAMCLDYATTMRWLTQLGLIEGYVRSIPDADRRRELVDAAYRDIAQMFSETEPEERAFVYQFELVRGRRPA